MGDGDDVVDGGTGNDDVSGNDGTDIVIGAQGQDIVSGGQGDDILYGDQYEDSSVTVEEIAQQADFIQKTVDVDFLVKLEVEDFKLRNFNKKDSEDDELAEGVASGDGVIITGGNGKAEGKFTGPTGIYDIVVGYYNAKDGEGELNLEIGKGKDKQSFDWELDKSISSETIEAKGFTTHMVRSVLLTQGEEIVIENKIEK